MDGVPKYSTNHQNENKDMHLISNFDMTRYKC